MAFTVLLWAGLPPSETLGKCGKVKKVADLFGPFGIMPIYLSTEQRQTPTTMSNESMDLYMVARLGLLTEDEAIAKAGADAVKEVEEQNCEATGRQFQGVDGIQEWTASVRVDIEDEDGDEQTWTLTAHYFPTDAEIERNAEDLSNVRWVIAGYSLS